METIALVSGGKDSFLSILHLISRGYHITAIANLYPPCVALPNTSEISSGVQVIQPRTNIETSEKIQLETDTPGNEDLNSFMYQTIGHQLLGYYADLLNVPLYRKRIEGGSVNQDLAYVPGTETASKGDETEDLLELVRYIQADFATTTPIKAVCSGAILSTYQRTRVESVCSRLGLLSVAPLWEMPQLDVLRDLQKMRIEARTLKVAAIGLEPEKWLWRNVADPVVVAHLKRCKEKWGVHPAGEGGEYETVVVDGPGFRYRAVVEEEDWEVVEVEGGVGYVRLKAFRLVENENWKGGLGDVTVDDLEGLQPSVLEGRFKKVYETLPTTSISPTPPKPSVEPSTVAYPVNISTSSTHTTISNIIPTSSDVTLFPAQLTALLATQNLTLRDITSTLLLLPTNESFAPLSTLYKTLFPFPSPPSRVCISVSQHLLPPSTPFVLSLTAVPHSSTRKTLHIQSQSNWAPASIGPYSQAVYTPELGIELAGQIALDPVVGQLVTQGEPCGGVEYKDVGLEACLALQNLYRVARRMRIDCELEYEEVDLEPTVQLDACGDPIYDDDDFEEEQEREELFLGGMTAYITDPSTVPIVCHVWNSIAPEEERGKLVIAQVEDLPRGAAVEWWAVSEGKRQIELAFGKVLQEGEDGVNFVRAGNDLEVKGGKVVRCWGVWDGEGREWDVAGWKRM